MTNQQNQSQHSPHQIECASLLTRGCLIIRQPRVYIPYAILYGKVSIFSYTGRGWVSGSLKLGRLPETFCDMAWCGIAAF